MDNDVKFLLGLAATVIIAVSSSVCANMYMNQTYIEPIYIIKNQTYPELKAFHIQSINDKITCINLNNGELININIPYSVDFHDEFIEVSKNRLTSWQDALKYKTIFTKKILEKP